LIVNEKLHKDDAAQDADASHYMSLIGSLLYLSHMAKNYVCYNSVKIHAKAKSDSLGVGNRSLRYL